MGKYRLRFKYAGTRVDSDQWLVVSALPFSKRSSFVEVRGEGIPLRLKVEYFDIHSGRRDS